MHRLVLVLLAAAATAAAAEAQTAAPTTTSLDRLWLHVNLGDRIAVTDRAGNELRGRVLDLSSSALALKVAGQRRHVHTGDIAVIRRRRRDPLHNGALLEFIAGALPPASLILAGGDAVPLAAVLGTSFSGAAGAAIGAGVDALIEPWQVVHEAGGAAGRLRIAPLLSRDRRGVSLALGF